MNKYDICLNCMETKGSAVICPYCKMVEDSSLESNLHLIPGTILQGKYLIGRALGQGGFGITYLAWDLNLNMKLAIKEYMPLDLSYRAASQKDISLYKKSFTENFNYGLEKYLEEAQTLAKFNDNPNTVNVSDFFKANKTAYIVMNYIDGITLKEYLTRQEKPLPFKKALNIFMPVLDALKEVHKEGLLHRDISPDNILITKHSRVVLIDFGAARQTVGNKSHTLSVILKPGFSPEEQYHSRGKQGPWTDIYALAASIYYTITRQVPPESLSRLSEDTIELPSALGSIIEPDDEKVLLKAMSLKAKDRYQSIEEVQQALLSKPATEAKARAVNVESSSKTNVFLHKNEYMENINNASDDWHIAKDNNIYHLEKSKSITNESDGLRLKESQQQKEQANEKQNNKAASYSKRWLLILSVLVFVIIFYVIIILSLPDPEVSALHLNYNDLELESGSTFQLEVAVEPARATVGELDWRSSNSLVVLVSSSGLLRPRDMGIATVIVQDKETGVRDQCTIAVVLPVVTNYRFRDGLYSGTLINNNLPHGEGTWVHPDGYEYEGEWKHGQEHGQGKYTFPSWDVYEGGFKDGQKHGRGSYITASGNTYLFEFADGIPIGTGTVVSPDGRTYEAAYDKDNGNFYRVQ